MVITESELREMWRDGRHALPAFASGTRFSPAAQDFLKENGLAIEFAPAAHAPEQNRGSTSPDQPSEPASSLLPVSNYQFPSLASLPALMMLVAAEARRYQLPELAKRLDALADECAASLTSEAEESMPTHLAGDGQMHTRPPEAIAVPADHAILHWLNYLRAQIADAEHAAHVDWLRAVGVAPTSGAASNLPTKLHALHLAVSGLMRQFQSGELGWLVIP